MHKVQFNCEINHLAIAGLRGIRATKANRQFDVCRSMSSFANCFMYAAHDIQFERYI